MVSDLIGPDEYGRLPCVHCGLPQYPGSPFCLACGKDDPCERPEAFSFESKRKSTATRGGRTVIEEATKEELLDQAREDYRTINRQGEEIRRLREALGGTKERVFGDGSPCWCPDWRWEDFREGDDPYEFVHHESCVRARAALSGSSAIAEDCVVENFSSRVCERGTKSCVVYHDYLGSSATEEGGER